jgi:hypothetical protein
LRINRHPQCSEHGGRRIREHRQRQFTHEPNERSGQQNVGKELAPARSGERDQGTVERHKIVIDDEPAMQQLACRVTVFLGVGEFRGLVQQHHGGHQAQDKSEHKYAPQQSGRDRELMR